MPNKPGLWSRLVDYLGFGPEEDEFEDEELEEDAARVVPGGAAAPHVPRRPAHRWCRSAPCPASRGP